MRHHLRSLRVVLIYAVIATLWILLSDRAVGWLFEDVESVTFVSSLKGLFFILVTGSLLFVLVSREFRGKNVLIRELEKTADRRNEIIRELHHRIRNSLQIIQSIISIEATKADTSHSLAATARRRILTMSAVYSIAYENLALERLPLATALERLNTPLRTIAPLASVRSTGLQKVHLPLEEMVTLLMLLLELMASLAPENQRCIFMLQPHDRGLSLKADPLPSSTPVIPEDNIILTAYLSMLNASLECDSFDACIIHLPHAVD